MRFIGKNFVFDERMGERISTTLSRTVISGAPCDTHTNCLNDGCHLLFIQCPSCAEKFAGCCSEACMEEHKLPEEEQQLSCAPGVKTATKSLINPVAG